MFCQKCGAEVEVNAKFCNKCGTAIEGNNSFVTQACLDEEIIDLSGQTDTTLPQEGKYKPILYAGIGFCLLWILYAVAGTLFHIFVMEGSDAGLIVALLIVSIPFILISIPLRLRAKKKAIGVGRTVGKGETKVIYAMTWITTAFALVLGFANAFGRFGLLGICSKLFFAFFAIVFIIMCNAFSNQSGAETYYVMFKALLSGFVLATPLGYVLGQFLRMIELGLIVILVGLVLFFCVGGRVFFVRYRD